jgi:uncharacterized membrane protein YphA (DoxX/SURF4 family)
MQKRWSTKRIAAFAGTWLVSLFLANVFFRAGVDKFSSDSGWARAFAVWGYPDWFRILIGVLEVAAAALVLLPRMAPIGALLIIAVMLGGLGTHAVFGPLRHMRSELVPLTLGAILLFARRDEWRALLARLRGRNAGLADRNAHSSSMPS